MEAETTEMEVPIKRNSLTVRYDKSEWIQVMNQPFSKIEGNLIVFKLLKQQLINRICTPEASVYECRANLEVSGFFLAAKIVDKLSMDKARLSQQRDLLKFVCRETWGFFFNKQADRLQTNKRGGYIIFDGEPPWLKGCPLFDPQIAETRDSPNQDFSEILYHESASGRTGRFQASADAQASIISGIIRGTLSVLGCECCVTQDLKALPGCAFHVTVLA
eukprot:Gregarina_sp_Poly_1__6281@NODE_3333_length_1173_cov_69_970163_g2111_i0_p1_GENE_NODE_3333_length_1173_cov_69_970163_g2111_i0NODE_3333_length_1173_cov_69_970163_g2111_i0_p1_ORF_typecomplete_len219_score29_67TRAPP/PF04051_16/2_4e24Phage_rep_O/PF04492_13/0_092Phage_rep_O/PF04492_13/7_2e03_NODE_3333_length_1173_cov_69_970163_g2111_i0198854